MNVKEQHVVTDQGRRYSKDEVFGILVAEILADELPGGTALTERTLVNRFGLSRTPIREVLLRLQGEYLVDFYPSQGAFVRKLTPKDVRDLLHIRQAVEPMAASLAALNRPEDPLAELVHQSESLATTPTMAELLSFAQALHDAVAKWSDNALLLDIYDILRKQTMLVRRMMRSHHDEEMLSLPEHRAILDAIVRRDADSARQAMETHLKRSYRSHMSLLMQP